MSAGATSYVASRPFETRSLLALARTLARPLLLVAVATLLIELVLPLALAAQVEAGS